MKPFESDRRSPARGASRPARRALGLAVAALLLAAAARGEPQRLAFARHAEPVATLDLASLRAAAPAAEVRVHEVYELREARFEALPFDRVLDAVYTPSWREEEELLFTCADGYQPALPVARFQRHRAWLAFARTDQPTFTLRKRESGEIRRVELGPFYLVWENLDDAQVRQEADYGWPYQLVAVDLIRTRDRFPRMMPAADAPEAVRAGFDAFRVHCSKCHPVHGEGGRIGPELVATASPVEYRDPDWLRTWIVDPTRIRPQARMPALNPALPERDRVVDEILAYLRAMVEAREAARGG